MLGPIDVVEAGTQNIRNRLDSSDIIEVGKLEEPKLSMLLKQLKLCL